METNKSAKIAYTLRPESHSFSSTSSKDDAALERLRNSKDRAERSRIKLEKAEHDLVSAEKQISECELMLPLVVQQKITELRKAYDAGVQRTVSQTLGELDELTEEFSPELLQSVSNLERLRGQLPKLKTLVAQAKSRKMKNDAKVAELEQKSSQLARMQGLAV